MASLTLSEKLDQLGNRYEENDATALLRLKPLPIPRASRSWPSSIPNSPKSSTNIASSS